MLGEDASHELSQTGSSKVFVYICKGTWLHADFKN
jgi:hypothetical protein